MLTLSEETMNQANDDDKLDTGGIAELLGVTRPFVTDKLTKRPDFPRPVVNLSQRLRKWRRRDIERYAARGA